MLRKLSIAALTLITVASITDAQSAQASGLVNGGFESPDLGNGPTVGQVNPALTGWKTTDTTIEIWANGFNGVTAAQGTQFAEINANINGTLFQDVTGIAAGQEVGFEFFHRARVGTDVMKLTITDLGLNGIFGGGDDTTLFAKNYSATTAAWVKNTNAGEAPIITLGNNLRFAYSAVSTGSGNPSVGNFLDAASFGLGVGAVNTKVPEPASILGLLTFGALGVTSLKRNRKEKVGA
jgi:hypothetical protein